MFRGLEVMAITALRWSHSEVRNQAANTLVKSHWEVGSEPILAVLQCQANS